MGISKEIIKSDGSAFSAKDRREDIETEDGLMLRILDLQFDEDTSLEAPVDRLVLSCVLEGHFEGYVEGMTDIVGDSSQLRVYFGRGTKSFRLSYPAGTHYRSVQVLASREYIQKHLAADMDALPDLLLSTLQSDTTDHYTYQRLLHPGLRIIAEQIMRCSLTGSLRDIFFRAKALELFSLGLSNLDAEEPSKQAMLLSVTDIERVREARDILLAARASPPTLSQLSRRVGLNEFKLKQGFRFVFNTTAFTLLNMDRMEEAERLLREGRMNVAEVGRKVGYTSNAAFSRAFRKCFGYPPSAILLNSTVDPNTVGDE